jgi:hypothetical protein
MLLLYLLRVIQNHPLFTYAHYSSPSLVSMSESGPIGDQLAARYPLILLRATVGVAAGLQD